MASIPGQTAQAEGQDSDRLLVARLRAGEEAAFAELIHLHGGHLLAVARRFLRNEDDAQDALQEALLAAFKSIHGFAGDARLSTWLHRVVVNACLMKLRTKRRRPERSIEDLLPTFRSDGHAATGFDRWPDPPQAAAERAELREIVRAAIDRLPENHRTILLLRDIEELDTTETARLLEISVEATKTRLHRARLALRGLLDPHMTKGLGGA